MKKHILTLLAATAAMGAWANSVPFEENFDEDWLLNFTSEIEGDHLPPVASINSLFMDSEGISRPWWTAKESSAATDRFLISHSWYQTPGTSNDWIISRPIFISGEGFTLSFEAQSLPMRSADKLSDLKVFISEEEPTLGNPPQEPAMFIEKVPYGESLDVVEGDFTPYSLNLDPWAGKTIYLSFVNQNTDNDILCINNVLIQRQDAVSVSAESPQYVVAGDYTVNVSVDGNDAEGLANWTLLFEADGVASVSHSGALIAEGDHLEYSFTGSVEGDDVSEWTVTLTGDGWNPVVVKGEVTGLLFEARKKVLIEEATGVWCGNCPLGIYNVECMMADDELKESVIPVAIHIPGGAADNMINQTYNSFIAMNVAPSMRIDRADGKIYTFSGYDYNFDKENPQTIGNVVLNRTRQLTFVDVDLDASFVVNRNDTTAINCKVTVRPNVTMDHAQHGIGLILVENNVWMKNHKEWRQENYFSGNNMVASKLNGWTELGDRVANVRFQDVARGIYGPNGFERSLPFSLGGGEEYEFSYTIDIPDTKTETSPAINPANLSVIAFVVNTESCEILNANVVPMTPQAEERFTTADLIKESAVETLEATYDGETRYFNLQGMPLSAPAKGEINIIRRGSKVTRTLIP